MSDELEALLSYCAADGRVCPAPRAWRRLWAILPERRRVGSQWEPSLPLILAAGQHSEDDRKRLLLAEHVRWAAEHNALQEVDDYLRGLSVRDWNWVNRPW